ncbi:MAG: 1-acyl-sn-glycerol-3-phosphate acyltransferase [Anaerolineae bacterium]
MGSSEFAQPDPIEMLTRINIQDMLDNFGLGEIQRGRGAIDLTLKWPARLLARQVVQFDARVGAIGLQAAARELIVTYVKRLSIVGARNVPRTGGALLVSNHPGMTDTLACFSAIPRPDLRVVSNDRPFLRALPHVSQYLLYVSEEPGQRLGIVRQVARHLQKGGAVMINPAGQIEPDPAVMRGAVESLATWSDSLALFVRMAPDAVIVPVIISGVIDAPSLRHPLTRLRRARKDREKVAASIQAFLHATGRARSRMHPRIEFGPPLPAGDLAKQGDAAAITCAITGAVRELIIRQPVRR